MQWQDWSLELGSSSKVLACLFSCLHVSMLAFKQDVELTAAAGPEDCTVQQSEIVQLDAFFPQAGGWLIIMSGRGRTG